MKKNSLPKRQLSRLRLAYEVQEIARPYVEKGDDSLNRVFFNHVAEEIPVCLNTFLKMMKEDVSDFPDLAKAYKEEIYARYLERLNNQKKKRIRK